jgi:hypothetical protein
MTTKSNICCLPLQYYMKSFVDTERGQKENDLLVIAPILGKEGWFYDRISKKEWYEYKGQAFFLGDGKQFIHELSIANTKLLSQQEVKAYSAVLHNNPPKKLKRLITSILRMDEEAKYLIKNSLMAKKFALRAKKRLQEYLKTKGK